MPRWNSCNILHLAPDAKRLWQFDAKGKDFALGREQKVSHAEKLPGKWITKSWSSLWQPRLNVAWMPLESVFLRVIELPASNFEETLAMVELQLEKISPIPVTQAVWTMHVAGTHQGETRADGTIESLQSVVVVIAERSVVEEYVGRLEKEGFLADRLEVPMLDQLALAGAAIRQEGPSAWLFPFSAAGQNCALVALWAAGVLKSLALVTLPDSAEKAGELKNQLAHIVWSGELEGWLTAPPAWRLVADPVNATGWETVLRTGLQETVEVVPPPALAEIAARTARRAASSGSSGLLLPEFAERYKNRFYDRLWMRGLLYTGAAYAVFLVIYFSATLILGFRVSRMETYAAGFSGTYTNSLQLKAVYNVLSERQQLKYAALDCWQWIAEELPQEITLQRMSFTDGHRLTLSGTVTQDQVNTLFDFNNALKKKKIKDQFVFDQTKGDAVNPRFTGNSGTWNMSLELLHSEAQSR